MQQNKQLVVLILQLAAIRLLQKSQTTNGD